MYYFLLFGQTFSIIVSIVVHGYPRRLPRLSLYREVDARLDWVVANYDYIDCYYRWGTEGTKRRKRLCLSYP